MFKPPRCSERCPLSVGCLHHIYMPGVADRALLDNDPSLLGAPETSFRTLVVAAAWI